ncbi:hypothetical protein HHI36_010047 [Cryptolaemus montrouzieri]|uniref:Uncharacterized protein n=1 Tax=Cryptolaemus montrouzieri TaxID=559131 RepID=A0ABD2MHJ4_9CUCU
MRLKKLSTIQEEHVNAMQGFGIVGSLGEYWVFKNMVSQQFQYKVCTEILPFEHRIAEAKLKDVDFLLKELFGENWRSDENFPGRMWYTELVDGSSPPDEPSAALQKDFEQQECNCLEDYCNLNI